MKKMRFKSSVLFHPLAFAAYPILFLYANNMEFFPLQVVVSPLVKILLFSLVLFVALKAFSKNAEEASIYVSFFLISFFSFYHFVNLASGLFGFDTEAISSSADLVLYLLWFSVFAATAGLLVGKIKRLGKLIKILNYTAGFLITISAVNIFIYQLEKYNLTTKIDVEKLQEGSEVLGVQRAPPDIYYIIVDGYARSDVLISLYDHDNSGFINFLKSKGFFVADQSSSNYAQTFLSMSSSLNLDYIDDLIDISEFNTNDRTPMYKLIKNSRVFSQVKKNGYDLVVISSGYPGTQIEEADLFITGRNGLSEFEIALIDTFPIPELGNIFSQTTFGDFETRYRLRILNIFSEISSMTEIPGPKLVFVHIISPHPPFLFDENGENTTHKKAMEVADGSHLINEDGITKSQYIKMYKNQVIFVNNKLEEVVNELLVKSKQEPIIIIQGDHGPGSETDWENPQNTNYFERFSILNAYYLPGVKEDNLYNSITPVNTFRIIFNNYFGTDYKLLEDKSYFSTWSKPYRLINAERVIK